jgi:hypothetical protein
MPLPTVPLSFSDRCHLPAIDADPPASVRLPLEREVSRATWLAIDASGRPHRSLRREAFVCEEALNLNLRCSRKLGIAHRSRPASRHRNAQSRLKTRSMDQTLRSP